MPEIEDQITYHGQRFECVELVEGYVNARGKPAPYSIWEALCAEPACTAFFRQSFPPDFPRKAVMLTRRCEAHRRPGVPVDPKRARGHNVDSFLAADWLYQFRLGTTHALTTLQFMMGAQANYSRMTPGVAQKLGVKAKTEHLRRQYVLRQLKVAQSIHRLQGRREGHDFVWDFPDTYAPALPVPPRPE